MSNSSEANTFIDVGTTMGLYLDHKGVPRPVPKAPVQLGLKPEWQWAESVTVSDPALEALAASGMGVQEITSVDCVDDSQQLDQLYAKPIWKVDIETPNKVRQSCSPNLRVSYACSQPHLLLMELWSTS